MKQIVFTIWLTLVSLVLYGIYLESLPEQSAKKAIAKLVQKSGTVQVRSEEQIIWSDAAKMQTLAQSDRISTGDNSSATIRFAKGRSLELGPNSQVEIDTERESDQENLTVTLLKGTVDAKVNTKLAQQSKEDTSLKIKAGSEEFKVDQKTSELGLAKSTEKNEVAIYAKKENGKKVVHKPELKTTIELENKPAPTVLVQQLTKFQYPSFVGELNEKVVYLGILKPESSHVFPVEIAPPESDIEGKWQLLLKITKGGKSQVQTFAPISSTKKIDIPLEIKTKVEPFVLSVGIRTFQSDKKYSDRYSGAQKTIRLTDIRYLSKLPITISLTKSRSRKSSWISESKAPLAEVVKIYRQEELTNLLSLMKRKSSFSLVYNEPSQWIHFTDSSNVLVSVSRNASSTTQDYFFHSLDADTMYLGRTGDYIGSRYQDVVSFAKANPNTQIYYYIDRTFSPLDSKFLAKHKEVSQFLREYKALYFAKEVNVLNMREDVYSE